MLSWKSKSYDELPALSVRGSALRQSLRIVTVAWMYGVVWMSCVSGDQMRALAKMMGFDDFFFGLMAAVPFIATFGQLNAAVVIERTGLRKYQFMDCSIVHRLLWLAVAMTPLLLPIPSGWAVGVMLVILAASSFLAAVATPAWMTWMGDLIPRRIRGRYFARRAQWTTIVQIVTVIAISIVLDLATVPGKPETKEGQPVLLYVICGIFAVGAVFGTIDILLFRRIREVMPSVAQAQPAPLVEIRTPPPDRKTPGSLLRYGWRSLASTVYQLLLDPLKDRVFRHYVFYGATITFTMTVAGWFFWRYATEGLGFSKLGTNLLFMVVGPLAGSVTANWWGTLQDRWGRRPVLIIATVGTVVSLAPWFFTTRDTPYPAFLEDAVNWIAAKAGAMLGRGETTWIDRDTPLGAYLLGALGCVIGGASWTGVSLAQNGIVLGFADGQGRSKYVAASSVLISIGGVLGGLVGGTVAQGLHYYQDHPMEVGPFLWNNWHATFALALVVRGLSLFWLVRMPDPGARSVRDLFRYWGENAYNTVTARLFYPLRIFGWGRGQKDQDR
jgi:MFS family permease